MKNDVILLLKNMIQVLKDYNDNILELNDEGLEIVSVLGSSISSLNQFLMYIDENYDKLSTQHREKFNNYSIPIINELVSELELILKGKPSKDTIKSIKEIDEKITAIESNFYELRFLNEAIQEYDNKTKNLVSELEVQVEKATHSVQSVISAKEALESKPTEDIYSNAAKKYIKTARFYDVLLLVLLGIFYYLTTQFFQNFQMIAIFKAIQKSSSEAQTLAIFFFITKLTIVSIVITLATIFIRRSSHFRKLHDQANQTSLELNALPLYLRQVDSELHSEIYKEMIPKFFGKELDQSQNDKVGDLVKDQLAAGTELIKASAEMVKNAKSLGDSSEKNKNVKTGVNSTESSENKDKPKTE